MSQIGTKWLSNCLIALEISLSHLHFCIPFISSSPSLLWLCVWIFCLLHTTLCGEPPFFFLITTSSASVASSFAFSHISPLNATLITWYKVYLGIPSLQLAPASTASSISPFLPHYTFKLVILKIGFISVSSYHSFFCSPFSQKFLIVPSLLPFLSLPLPFSLPLALPHHKPIYLSFIL